MLLFGGGSSAPVARRLVHRRAPLSGNVGLAGKIVASRAATDAPDTVLYLWQLATDVGVCSSARLRSTPTGCGRRERAHASVGSGA